MRRVRIKSAASHDVRVLCAQAIMKHSGVAECAVVGVPDSIKGEVPLALFVLKDGTYTKRSIEHYPHLYKEGGHRVVRKFTLHLRPTLGELFNTPDGPSVLWMVCASNYFNLFQCVPGL